METIGKVRIEAGYRLYYRTVHFIRYYNGSVAIKEDVSILRRCRLKYLVGKHYGICNLFSNGSAKSYIFKYREKASVKILTTGESKECLLFYTPNFL